MASSNVRMPMTSAGIIGTSSDIELSGIKLDPRAFIIATLIFVAVVKLATVFIK